MTSTYIGAGWVFRRLNLKGHHGFMLRLSLRCFVVDYGHVCSC